MKNIIYDTIATTYKAHIELLETPKTMFVFLFIALQVVAPAGNIQSPFNPEGTWGQGGGNGRPSSGGANSLTQQANRNNVMAQAMRNMAQAYGG